MSQRSTKAAAAALETGCLIALLAQSCGWRLLPLVASTAVLVKLAEQLPAEPSNFSSRRSAVVVFCKRSRCCDAPAPSAATNPHPQPRHLITVSLSGESVTMETGAEAAEGGGRKKLLLSVWGSVAASAGKHPFLVTIRRQIPTKSAVSASRHF